ncbi:MAG: aldose 1-epimerase family protein [Kiritimatiellia bacterium]|nr:aldose 1-epimerase family protein [Kiritimatiellia bacterium]
MPTSVTLTSPSLSVRIAQTGAEIKSIQEKSTGIEYMWQSDPAYWTGAAPILFPIIGGLKNGKYTFNGKDYSMPSHGLVRKADWALVNSGSTSASFEIASSAETREMYPFDYALRAHFTLSDNILSVRYEVSNTGNGTMYFSIGSHPAFNIPFAGGHLEHYYYHFSESETIERNFFGGGLTLNRTAPVFDNSRQIFITRKLFEQAAIILKNPASKEVSIRNSRNNKQIKVTTDGMPFLGLWGPPGVQFACIEPWYGVPDNEATDGEFTTKEGIMSLAANGTYETTYRIEIV